MNQAKVAIVVEGVEFFHVPGFEGYAISKGGQVRSLDRVMVTRRGYSRFSAGREIRPYVMPNGYHQVALTGGKKDYVHRLMGFAFIGLKADEQIDHKNLNKDDNSLENLRVASPSENSHNVYARGYYWVPRISRWHAQLVHRKKKHSLGYFNEESDARGAYLKAKNRLKVLHPNR